MAQLVEHNLAKVGVAGSSPVVRSIECAGADFNRPFAYTAKWPSGKAEACKAFTPGSNPGFASIALQTGVLRGARFLIASPCHPFATGPLAPRSMGELGCVPRTTCRPIMIRPACLETIASCQAEKLWTPRRPFASLFLHPRRLGAYVSFSASRRFANLNAGRSQHIIPDLLKHNI